MSDTYSNRLWVMACLFWSLGFFQAKAQNRPSNVLIILTDDQGWGELSHTGNTNLQTPNIDQLALKGLVLTGFMWLRFVLPRGQNRSPGGTT